MKIKILAGPAARRALLGRWLAALLVASMEFLPVHLLADTLKTIHIKAPDVTAKLQMLERLPAGNQLTLAIGLPLRNTAALKTLLQQLYDRASPKFHHFLTPAQFTAQFGPSEADYQNVKNFAKSHRLDITHTSSNRVVLEVSGKVADIETAFHVHLGVYPHPTENRTFYAPDSQPSVPSGLPVICVSGMDNYVVPRPHGHTTPLRALPGPAQSGTAPGGSAPFGGLYIGNDLRHAYVPGTTLTGAGQVVGLYEAAYGYTPSNVKNYELQAFGAGATIVPLVNPLSTYPDNYDNNSAEVTSDIELAIAMAPGLKAVNVYEGKNGDTIMNEIASPSQGETLPNQVSSSWGMAENATTEQDLQSMAVEGVTFFIAIGDSGAFANGKDTSDNQDSPYMTAVGGTQLFMSGTGTKYLGEKVWNDGVSGTTYNYFSGSGGIQTSVAIPDFQLAVSMALNHGSTIYRNVPDVALVARDIYIVISGTTNTGTVVPDQGSGWVGTSASSPFWAGLCALVNQQAVAEGKPTVGYLLPALYAIGEGGSYATTFNDIVTGSNAWSDPYNNTSSNGLYSAAPGYDLCSGWGTPKGPALIDALAGFSGPVFVDFNYTGPASSGTAQPAGSYNYPFPTMAKGVAGVTSGGTIIIRTAGSSSETPTISKPVTITAGDGAGTIGR